MSTTPPEHPSGQYDQPPGAGGAAGSGTAAGGYGGGRETSLLPATNWDVARLPLPGNAELLVWALALLVAAIVTAIADDLGAGAWFDFFKWTAAAYLLSRGIAKASRVLEQ